MVDERVMVFALTDGKKHTLLYSLDLTVPGAKPRRESRLANEEREEVAASDDFEVEEREEESTQDEEGILIGRKRYRIGEIELLPASTVVIAQEERPRHLTAGRRAPEPLSLMGLRARSSGGFDQLWERPISVSTEELMADDDGDAVYFADVGPRSIAVAGVRAADGRPLPSFPANFRWRVIGGRWFEARIAGTDIDSRRGLVFLHDLEENRIVCARHRFE